MVGAFLVGALILVLLLFALNSFTKANPATLARWVKRAGAVAMLLVAFFFLLRGQWVIAVPVAAFGLSMLGFHLPGAASFGSRTNRTSGQTSTVRGNIVEMTLDHDTGEMSGVVMGGAHRGVALDDLDVAQITALFGEADADSAALLEAYLDRRAPGWRDDAETDTGGRQGQGGPVEGPMTQEEAYEVLGLAPGAGDKEIRSAHRALMKRLHPDRGGSTYLAAKINEAKDLLLNAHR
ncbi:DnaJ domain-containing protein [Tepidamorphus sp. 3E244]|uniref:DnaJ domain-containing protein n=1 Tax=Tepidamorphus sp. 3E244 TaxID=3385498 RepID=UPI0038FD022C